MLGGDGGGWKRSRGFLTEVKEVGLETPLEVPLEEVLEQCPWGDPWVVPLDGRR